MIMMIGEPLFKGKQVLVYRSDHPRSRPIKSFFGWNSVILDRDKPESCETKVGGRLRVAPPPPTHHPWRTLVSGDEQPTSPVVNQLKK